MSGPAARCACEPALALVMRARLLCGLYSRRAVPPRRRRLAQAYCLTVAAAVCFHVYYLLSLKDTFVFRPVILATEYLFGFLVSLWTGDEYIYTFFTQNALIDVTLDSRFIFGRFQRDIKKACIIALFYSIVHFALGIVAWHEYGFVLFIVFVLPALVLDMFGISVSTSKLLVMGLFNARMLVLKRRLQRHGFRAVGRAPPQPYCQVYDEILQMLGATDNPLKFVLFFDLIFGCSKLISLLVFAVYYTDRQVPEGSQYFALNLYAFITFTQTLVVLFGHVALLESAAAHCEDMAVFTATQLIKTPTAAERRRMHLFLRSLERRGRGARYRVLRALPQDARLALRALDFCCAQIIVLFNTIWAH